jgi:predicted membrane protein
MSDENKFDAKKFSAKLRYEIHQDIKQTLGQRMSRARGANGIIPGIVLVTVGSIFLLDHLGIVHAESLWRFWPLILIAVGLMKIFHDSQPLVGIGFVVVGGLVQLHELGLIGLSWGAIWPFILIAAGVLLILKRFEMPRASVIGGVPGSPEMGEGSNTISEYALFGGVERRVNNRDLRGGNISAIFGGVELDFRSADIEGEEATIFVEAIFGGVEVVVPDRWNVTFQIQSIFAGYTDERNPPIPDPLNTIKKKNLILRGRAIFGGVVVKN